VNELSEQEALVDQYVKESNTEAAVALLLDLITRCAKEKDFVKANVLREKLSAVDSMALTEIIRSGEIIEEEQRKSIDKNHLNIWSDLYGSLTTEETNALYYAMKECAYDADQLVFKQGERDPNLYFIDGGQLSVVCSKGGMEILLKTIGSGDIAGEDTFFSNTVCTASLMTLSRAKLRVLNENALTAWQEAVPSLEAKLHDYCLRFEKVDQLLKKKGLDRRYHRRVNISGKCVIQILSVSGNPAGKAFKGNLSDISVGGLSFFVKISKKETASLLLGRNLNIKCNLPSGDSQEKMDQNGTVVAVRSHPFEDYSIHVKFDKALSERVLEDLESVANPDQW
jgi:CRP-like cAMP-binding protein